MSHELFLVPELPRDPIIQPSAKSIIVYFKPSPNVNYYSIEIAPETNKNQIIITKIIQSEPYQANLEDAQLIPGKNYIATISSYNEQGERNDRVISFSMENVPKPEKLKLSSGSSWIIAEWLENNEIEKYEVSLSRQSDDRLIEENLDVNEAEFRFQGLDKDTAYIFTIRSVIKNVRSKAIVKMITTNDFNEINGGLLMNNDARTVAPAQTTQFAVTTYQPPFTAITQMPFTEANERTTFFPENFEEENTDIVKYQNFDAGISCLRTSDKSEYKLINLYFLVKELSQSEYFDFNKLKIWMVELIKNLPTGSRFIRVALATYSNDLKIEFLLDSYTNSKDITKHILNMQTRFKKPRDGRLGRALFKTNDNILQPQFYKGDELTYIYIVTNSLSIDPVTEAVDKLQLSIFDPVITLIYIETEPGLLNKEEILVLESVVSVPQRLKRINSYDRLKFDITSFIAEDLSCTKKRWIDNPIYTTQETYLTTAGGYGTTGTNQYETATSSFISGTTNEVQTNGLEPSSYLPAPENFRLNYDKSVLSGQTENRKIQLNWEAVPQAAYYKIFQFMFLNQTGTEIEEYTVKKETKLVLKGNLLRPGRAFYWLLSAVDEDGCCAIADKTDYNTQLVDEPKGMIFLPPPNVLDIFVKTTQENIEVEVVVDDGDFYYVEIKVKRVQDNFIYRL